MTNYRLTQHASEMLGARGISETALAAALNEPDLVRPDSRDETLENWYKVVPPTEGRVLKVVVRKDGTVWVVVTAYFDRSMRGKI